ncbi:MAG: HepT-like ribonuclease domain-containing protein [Patescibacteria group bacterium]
MRDSKTYIDLIIAACEKIGSFVGHHTKEEFFQNLMLQSAVIMQLHVIGETARKIDTATQARIDIPWKKIVGLRNRISHDYFELKLDFIWNMASEDVPSLESKLRAYLREQGNEYIPPFGDSTSLLD